MAKSSPAITAFNSGELTPWMEGRIDQQKYQFGLHYLRNFIPLVQGPAMRRGGTRFVAEVADSTKRTWIRRFEFSQTQAFQIEFGDGYLRFYTNHGQLQPPGGIAAWNSGTLYNVGDLVTLAGTIYYASLQVIGTSPPFGGWTSMPNTTYQIPSPWVGADLTDSTGRFNLKIEQSGDVLYIAGGAANTSIATTGYQPYTLTRVTNTKWILAPFAPTDGPFLNQNTDATTAIWADGQTGFVNLKSNKPVFAGSDASSGRLIRLDVQNFSQKPWLSGEAITAGMLRRSNGNTYLAVTAGTAGTVGPSHIAGSATDGGVIWTYQDSGYGIAKIIGFTSSTNAQAMVIKQLPIDVVGVTATITGITQANPGVVTAANTFANGDMPLITGVVGMTQVNDQLYSISAVSGAAFTLTGINTSGYSAYVSGGTAINKATTRWSLGAWSSTTEWPRAVKFFRGRLFWFGKIGVWSSVSGLYTSYAIDSFGVVTAANAISGYINFEDVNSVMWAMALDRLIIGTDGGEFALFEQANAQPLGPNNWQIVRQSKKRCNNLQPVIVGTTGLYCQRAGRKMLGMDYDFTIDKYRSVDFSAMAYQATFGGLLDMDYQAEPWSVIWAPRGDGLLAGFTFDKEQDVFASHPHQLGGNGIVECVSAIPAPDLSRDEIWMIVRRTINGQTKRYIEYMEKPYEDGDTQSSCFYVDCGGSYNGVSTSTVTGLTWLEGQTVSVLVNGAAHPDVVVTGGAITLQYPGTIINVGLPCPCYLDTERLEAGADVGTSQGKTKRAQQIVLRFHNTLGAKFGNTGGVLDDIPFRDPSMAMDTAIPLFTGDKILNFPTDYQTDMRIHIENTQPLPMTVVAIFPSITGYEPT